ncbi:hypothetical protein MTR_3g085015 [Medicago truncatula]|uniref:Uncharacterized protein n=1 Tax=Medicago truncatula TaxID=3880 RepID=A0A072V1J7_MEDTR|nr:hypothetical protein MTR_3g085015 [Medicago truncatula]
MASVEVALHTSIEKFKTSSGETMASAGPPSSSVPGWVSNNGTRLMLEPRGVRALEVQCKYAIEKKGLIGSNRVYEKSKNEEYTCRMKKAGTKDLPTFCVANNLRKRGWHNSELKQRGEASFLYLRLCWRAWLSPI